MADLVVYLPGHGYADNTLVFCSWLDGPYNIDDPTANSFKLTNGAAGPNIEYTSTVASGYVREVSSGITSITGLDHLEGESVYVAAEGSIVGMYTVSDGAVTVPSSIYTYQAGKAYAWKVKTMRFAVPGGANVQARVKRLSGATLRFIRSVGGKAGQQYDDVEYLGDLDATFSVKSADSSILTKGGFSTDGVSVIKGDQPLPFTGLALITELEVWEP